MDEKNVLYRKMNLKQNAFNSPKPNLEINGVNYGTGL
jgi:hypothetical protein